MRTKSHLATALVLLLPFAPRIHASTEDLGEGGSSHLPVVEIGCAHGDPIAIEEHADAPDPSRSSHSGDVLPCTGPGPCDPAEDFPVMLARVDSSALLPAVEEFDRACRVGYVWCDLFWVQAYEVADCTSGEVTLEAIVQALGDSNRSLRGGRFERGKVFARADLPRTPFFSTIYSPAGPALLSSIDAFAGDTEVEMWFLSTERACHNCSEFQDVSVLWYPATGMVVVLYGIHGYDS